MIPLSLEIEQDFHANRANTDLLGNDAIPQGLPKTDQTLRPEEADQLEERWERKYSRSGRRRKVAGLGRYLLVPAQKSCSNRGWAHTDEERLRTGGELSIWSGNHNEPMAGFAC